jgi:putative ABC transport system permease protein
MTRLGERIFGRLLGAYPREFRERYRDDLIAFFREDRAHPRYGSGPLRPVRFWIATLRDLARSAWRQRAGARTAGAPAAAGGPRRGPGRLAADARLAVRALRTSPGVTVPALLVLTLGIGATTAIFSVVDAVVLRGLPFDDADALVAVAETRLPGGDRGTVAWPNYADWRARQRVFSGMAASANAGTFATAERPVAELRVVRITASLFDVLRVAPEVGRPFRESDEQAGASRVLIISHALWQSRFGGAADVVGRTITLGTVPFEIVGVMPRGFVYPIGPAIVSAVDAWVPFTPASASTVRTGGRNYNLTVVARLANGITLDRASTEMKAIRDTLAVEHPRWFVDHGVTVLPFQEAIVGADVRSWMLFLLAAVGCVLLIACLNVANLLVARAAGRAREIAVRAALGASRRDLAQSLIVESLLLALAGAACGTVAAAWGVEILRSTLPEHLPRLAEVALDLRVLAVTAATAGATGLLFGTWPALRLSRPDVSAMLRDGGRSGTAGAAGARLRAGLVVAEVALAGVLLAGAGLFIASFGRVLQIDLGLDPSRVASVGVSFRRTAPGPTSASDRAVRQALITGALGSARAVPGVVAAAALGGGLPLTGNSISVPVQFPGRDAPPFTGDDEAFVHSVTADYLNVVSGTLAAGRFVADADVAGAPPVVVVSDEAVRRYFGSRSPIGETILLDGQPRTVVGVVRGMRHGGPEQAVRPEVFVPFLQGDQSNGEVVVRTATDPGAIAGAVQAALQSAIPGAVVGEPQFLDRWFAVLVAQRKFNMIVLTLFGSLGVVIAAVGVYGLMAFVVAQRTREIGVRVALGAAPGGIVGMVIGRASRLLLAGLALGLAGALSLERLVRAFLFEAQAYDPSVYAGAAVVLFSLGLSAALGPARRAARVDPLVALRAE